MNSDMQTTTTNNNNTKYSSCTECGVVFSSIDPEDFKLSALYTGKKKTKAVTLEYPFCVACFRLFGGMKTYLQKYKVILWLLSGECEEEFGENESLSSLQARKYNKIAQRIRQRAKAKSEVAPDRLKVATGSELMDLIVKNGPNDAMLGHRLFLFDDGSRFNSLTFDHIVPVATIKNDPIAFSIDNIQLMSRCLNNVKGDSDDYELIFWLHYILAACIERYSDL